MQAAGLNTLQANVIELLPQLADRVTHLDTWDDVHFLQVRVDHLRRWYRRGLLCIGDAAHAMSPTSGVGINLAVHDAVATANILAPALLRGESPPTRQLRRVQWRRQLPARVTQAVQVRALRGLNPKRLGDNILQCTPIAAPIQPVSSIAFGRRTIHRHRHPPRTRTPVVVVLADRGTRPRSTAHDRDAPVVSGF